MELSLGDVQTTALIPVAIKANETKRANARICDNMAVKIIDDLKLDTAPFDKFLSHEGVIARTIMLDRWLKDFIEKNPETTVVNLGAGFDSRFSRVDNGKIAWFDVDFPDIINARSKIFPEQDRVTLIASNILTDSWVGCVQETVQLKKGPVVFIAEGLFMYLSMEEITTLFQVLKNAFDSGILVAEQNCPLMMKNQKHHDTVKNTNAVFKSGTKSAKELEGLVKGIKLLEEHSFNEEMKKYSIRAKIFAALLPGVNDRWAWFQW